MSATEYTQTEQHSSVKIAMTAKGDATVEVKAYSHDLDALEATRIRAVEIYRATVADVRP
jgi:hypothetical protein